MSRNIQSTGATENDYPTSASLYRWGVLRAHRLAVSALSEVEEAMRKISGISPCSMRTTYALSRIGLVLVLGTLLAVGPAVGQAAPNATAVKDLLGAQDGTSLGIDWASLFTEMGKPKDEVDATGALGSNGVADFKDLYGGIDAMAIEDNISGGVAVDMSKLTGGPAIAQCVVRNDTVGSAHDQGNTYMYTTYNALDELVVYFGVERLGSQTDTYLKIELNQQKVQVAMGSPWPVKGGRIEDDLLIRVDYSLGVVSSVEVKRWAIDAQGDGAFESVGTYGGLSTGSCNGVSGVSLFCAGSPPIAAPQEVWDSAGNGLAATPPDDFLEIGANVSRLLNVADIEYTAIQVKTPEDIAFGSFRAIGHWSN